MFIPFVTGGYQNREEYICNIGLAEDCGESDDPIACNMPEYFVTLWKNNDCEEDYWLEVVPFSCMQEWFSGGMCADLSEYECEAGDLTTVPGQLKKCGNVNFNFTNDRVVTPESFSGAKPTSIFASPLNQCAIKVLNYWNAVTCQYEWYVPTDNYSKTTTVQQMAEAGDGTAIGTIPNIFTQEWVLVESDDFFNVQWTNDSCRRVKICVRSGFIFTIPLELSADVQFQIESRLLVTGMIPWSSPGDVNFIRRSFRSVDANNPWAGNQRSERFEHEVCGFVLPWATINISMNMEGITRWWVDISQAWIFETTGGGGITVHFV